MSVYINFDANVHVDSPFSLVFNFVRLLISSLFFRTSLITSFISGWLLVTFVLFVSKEYRLGKCTVPLVRGVTAQTAVGPCDLRI